MKPPVVAQGILAAAAPTSEYQIIAGDLHEEYLRVVSSSGTKAANRWYWAQILLSIPWLISYSRSKRSTLRRTSVALISLAVLFAMLLVTTVIGTVFQSLFGIDRIPDYVWILRRLCRRCRFRRGPCTAGPHRRRARCFFRIALSGFVLRHSSAGRQPAFAGAAFRLDCALGLHSHNVSWRGPLPGRDPPHQNFLINPISSREPRERI